NMIGGTVAAARNLIAGFRTPIGLIFGGNNKVQGNYIGTDAIGTQPLGSSIAGVGITASNNTVGGTDSGAGNLIGFINGHGVEIGFIEGAGGGAAAGNAVRRNSIFGGTGSGISFNLVTAPKAPVLTATGGTLTGAKPNTTYTIEFFSNPTCDPGKEQGKTFVSDITVMTDANGNTSTPFNIPAGQNVSATASAAGENT